MKISFETFQDTVRRVYPHAEGFTNSDRWIPANYSCVVKNLHSAEFISYNPPSGLWFVHRETSGGSYDGSGLTLELALNNLQWQDSTITMEFQDGLLVND